MVEKEKEVTNLTKPYLRVYVQKIRLPYEYVSFDSHSCIKSSSQNHTFIEIGLTPDDRARMANK